MSDHELICPMEIKNIFRRMLSLLESKQVKWIQKQLAFKDTGGFTLIEEATHLCLVGIVHRAIYEEEGTEKIMSYDKIDKHLVTAKAVFDILKEKCQGFFSVADWNDSPTRTEEDVLNLIREQINS